MMLTGYAVEHYYHGEWVSMGSFDEPSEVLGINEAIALLSALRANYRGETFRISRRVYPSPNRRKVPEPEIVSLCRA